jgi:hypothetical protein
MLPSILGTAMDASAQNGSRMLDLMSTTVANWYRELTQGGAWIYRQALSQPM